MIRWLVSFILTITIIDVSIFTADDDHNKSIVEVETDTGQVYRMKVDKQELKDAIKIREKMFDLIKGKENAIQN
jgi:hypothetical protein